MFKIELTRKAGKELKELDRHMRKRLKQKLAWYISHDDPLVFADKLTDFKAGQYRYRIGSYRVVFELRGETIYITRINHRREIYR